MIVILVAQFTVGGLAAAYKDRVRNRFDLYVLIQKEQSNYLHHKRINRNYFSPLHRLAWKQRISYNQPSHDIIRRPNIPMLSP